MRNPQWKFWGFSRNEISHLGLLFLLYTLQGIPMGLSAALPYALQGKISYSSQGLLSLLSLPFSLKLLWAPLVDTIYSNKFGRRKSWLIPAQFLSAILMIWGDFSGAFSKWLGEDASNTPNVTALLLVFGFLYFLIATQDIAVDGWSLTMLPPHHVEYASTCNSVGQIVGYYLAFVGYLILNDAPSCNKYIRRTPSSVGLVTFSSLSGFFGYILLFVTFGILFFKKEDLTETLTYIPLKSSASFSSTSEDLQDIVNKEIASKKNLPPKNKFSSILNCYILLWQILCVSPFRSLLLILLTCRIAFSATDAATTLKIIEFGLPKEKMALLLPLLVPASIISTIIVSKLCVSTRAMIIFRWGIPFRLVMCVIWMGMLMITQGLYNHSSETFQAPLWYYFLLIVVLFLYNLTNDLMFVSQMAFFAKISDPKFGGSYMTFLNTAANLGYKWPQIIILPLLDYSSIKRCPSIYSNEFIDGSHTNCRTLLDGYYVLACCCVACGLLWIYLFQPLLIKIDSTQKEDWLVKYNCKEKC